MTTYSGNADTYHSSTTLYSITTLVQGGLAGSSNVCVREISDNLAYFQKYKGRIVRGTGEPTLSTLTGFTLDSNTENNLLYLDHNSGSLWKPTISGSSLTGWTNLYKTITLNVSGIRLNDSGDDTDYVQLKYDQATHQLKFTTDTGGLADISVGKISFTRLNASDAINELRVTDNEILLCYSISQESENTDGLFSVKRLIDIATATVTSFEVAQSGETVDKWYYSGTLPSEVQANTMIQVQNITESGDEEINGYYLIETVTPTYFTTKIDFKQIYSTNKSGLSGTLSRDNSAIIKWNEALECFELVDRDGSLLPLECAGFYINGVAQSFVPTRVITTTAQFDELFGHVATGDDRCYLRKPETGYVTDISNEYIYLKYNADVGTNGNYTLNNRVDIIGSNVKIECAPGVFVIQNADDAYFSTRDYTNLTVDTVNVYTKSPGTVNILGINSYYTDGENAGDQVQLVANDVVYGFSDLNKKVNQKYTISNIIKNVTETGKSVSGIDFADFSDYSIASVGNLLVHAYVDSGFVKLQAYQYSAGSYSAISSEWVSSLGSYSNVSICVSGNTVHISATKSSELKFTTIDDITVAPVAFDITDSVENSSTYDNARMCRYGNIIYILGKVSNTLKLFYGTYIDYFTPITFSNITIENTDISSTKYDMALYSNTMVVSYSSSDELKLAFVDVTTSPVLSSTVTQYAIENDNSKLVLSGASNEMYCIWNESSVTGENKDIIKFGEIDVVAETLSNIVTVIPSTSQRYDNFYILMNTSNQFNNDADLIQFVAFHQNNSNITYAQYDGLEWSTNTFALSTSNGSGGLVRLDNDYIFLFNRNTVTQLIKYRYNIKITFDEDIDDDGITATDIIISPDYIENTELIMNFDGDLNASIPHTTRCKNAIESRFTHQLKNCASTNGLNFGNKGFFNTLKVTCTDDANNSITNNISGFSHGMVTESYLENNVGKNFIDCRNINVMAFVNNNATLMNGDFNV